MEWVLHGKHFIPLPVICGVQLSQGLSSASSSIKYIRYNQNFVTSKSTSPPSWLGLDGLILAISALIFLILTTGSGGDNHTTQEDQDEPLTQSQRRVRKRMRILSVIPSALIVFLLGLVLFFIRDPLIIKDLRFGPSRIQILKITLEDWKIGFLRGVIHQIPLLVLNSVIAVRKLSTNLFPDHDLSATKVSASVGVMNLVGCWYCAMPVCHGTGGLAGQYRFGARSGASVVFLGIMKLVIGLVFGNSFVRILNQFSIGILCFG